MSVEDNVDDGIDISDVDFSIVVHVSGGCTAMTIVTAHDDNINHAVCIGNVNLTVAIHIIGVALYNGSIIPHALVDDLAVHDDVAQSAIFLVVGIGVGFAGERSQQVAHVAAVDADALDDVAQPAPPV